MAVSRPRVILNVSIGTEPAGRLVIELFVDKTPKTCEKYEFPMDDSMPVQLIHLPAFVRYAPDPNLHYPTRPLLYTA